MRVANAPVSFGVFELTLGAADLPGPDDVLGAVAAAGYEGVELGPPGFLGAGEELRARLDRHGLELVGGWCQLAFSEPAALEDGLAELARALDRFEEAGAPGARPVLGDAGSDARRANPGRGGEAFGLDRAGWARFAGGLARTLELARGRGFEPVFHPHTSTYVESPAEIERVLELSDVDLLLDTGHLLVGGGDPVRAVAEWGTRLGYVHLKDVRLDVLRAVVAERAGALEAWRRGLFCELGAGDADLDGFLGALRAAGYDGWLCVEQDRIPAPRAGIGDAAAAQVRNRDWLRERGI